MQVTAEWADIRRSLDLLHKVGPEYVTLSVDAKGQATLSAATPIMAKGHAYLLTRLPAKTSMTGEVLLPYARLRGVIKSARSQHVTFAQTEGAVQVTADAFRARLIPAPLELEYAGYRFDGEESAELCALPCGLFKGLVSGIAPYVPCEAGRFDHPIALFECDGSTMRAVGMSSFSMAICEEPIGAAPCRFVVPRRAIDLIFALDGLVLRISASESFLTFETEKDLLRLRAARTQFPPYSRLFPDTTTTTITIADKLAFQIALKRIFAVGDQINPRITCNAEANGNALHIRAGELFERGNKVLLEDCDVSVPVVVVGPAIDFSFDVKLFLPFLKKAAAPIVLRIKDNRSALDFQTNDGHYRYLQSPTDPNARTIGAVAK